MDEGPKGRVYLAALAGLLHDVGKFAQRAEERGTADSKTARRDFGHYHALLTYDTIPKLMPGALGDEVKQTLQRAAGYHHKPGDELGVMVQLADHLSAGEREDDEDNLTPYLESIFFRLGGRKPQGKKGYLPLKVLDPTSEWIFPHERDLQWKDTCQQEYDELWQSFVGQAGQLPGDSLPLYLEAMLDLLQRYTWCIPSAYYHSVPDVSLYDHSRTTAALAACFAADRRDTAWCQARMDEFWNDKSGEPVALLVAGDISGVQKFLYSIASDGAAKALRGRSVYLQLVTEAVAQSLLQELGLPLTNLLYAGGGNFYLIAPLQPQKPLADLQAEVTRKLFDAHEGNLRLALAWTPVQAAEFKIGAFVQAWDRLHERLRRVKERPLAELAADAIKGKVGTGYGEGGNVGTCPICGREEQGVGDSGCQLCQSFAELGRQVAHATHLVMAVGTPATSRPRVDRWHQGLEQFGVNVWVVDVDHPETSGKYLPGGPDRAEWVRLYPLGQNRDEAREHGLIAEARAKLNAPLVRAFRPFAQIVPFKKNGEAKTFDELAKQSRGIERWGVLRMDVDNLGDLFRKGFRRGDRDCLTLSRVAALSFALRLFFEGYLPTIGKPWEGRLYLQYAGGDDLFVVGAWDALPEFAAAVREQFGKYACDNPCATLSGGITLHPEKFPLYRAADEAHGAEQAAKRYKREQPGQDPATLVEKDALCFLDLPLGWEKFGEVQALVRQMAGWVENGQAPKSLLQTLLRLYHEWNRGRDQEVKAGRLKRYKPYFGPWVWLAVYRLHRIASAKDTHTAVKSQVEEWLGRLLNPAALADWNVQHLGLAARWAELLTRSQEKGL